MTEGADSAHDGVDAAPREALALILLAGSFGLAGLSEVVQHLALKASRASIGEGERRKAGEQRGGLHLG